MTNSCILTFSSLQYSHIGRHVRYEHMSGLVRNGERYIRVQQNGLRCHPTRVKDGNIVGVEFHGVSPVRSIQIRDSDAIGASNADGSTVCVFVGRCDFDFSGNLQGGDWFHGNNHIALQSSGGSAFQIGSVHGNVFVLFE